MTRDYDTTIARMAGNIMGSLIQIQNLPASVLEASPDTCERLERMAVLLARGIVREIRRTGS